MIAIPLNLLKRRAAGRYCVTDSPVFMPVGSVASVSARSCCASAGGWRPSPFQAIPGWRISTRVHRAKNVLRNNALDDRAA
jgi:hypothetical protein